MPAITNPSPSQLDQNQILQRAFDESKDRLRVDLAATIVAGQLEVAISHVDDSIRLGDGTTLTTVTTVGTHSGLDVKSLQLANESYVAGSTTASTTQVALRVGGSNLANRQSLILLNTGGRAIYVGPSGVTSTTGLRVQPNEMLTLAIGPNVTAYAVTTTGTCTVAVQELA